MPLREKSPVPVSTATRNKLSAFQFGRQSLDGDATKQEAISLLSDDEKENRRMPTKSCDRPKSGFIDAEVALPSEAAPAESSTNDVPSTPAGRLALPDLIGMGDIRRMVQNVSPEDRIEWDQHSANSSFAITTKKRARSSSPTSSPVARTPSRFNDKGGLLHPQLDPGSELWGRYSLNGSTPQGQPIPSLANLLNTSSPRVTKERATSRAIPGFRRANSCGNQFPKRRRVGGPDQDVFTEGGGAQGPSKLSVLIERIQEGLIQSKEASPEAKSCSTPLSTGELSLDEDQAPTTLTHDSPPQGDIRRGRDKFEPQDGPKTSENAIHNSLPSESDYGEFYDEDLDDLTLIDAISQSHPPPIPTADSLPAADSQHIILNHAPKQQGLNDETAGNNEFDDSDDDLFAADLEDMVAQFDSQHTALANKTITTDSTKEDVAPGGGSEDEFGDDGFDDLDFQMAEVAATQSKLPATSSILPVRTKFL